MQSILFIQHSQQAHDAIFSPLARRFAVDSTQHIGQARDMVQHKQLIVLSMEDIHEHERIYFLRELVLDGYKVITLLPPQHAPLQRACALLGAHGMLERDCSEEMLLRSIEIVQSNQLTYPPALLSTALAFYYANLPSLPKLTMAILNTLFILPQGTNSDVAKQVDRTEGTIRNNLTQLFKKFGVRSRCELVNAATNQGYFAGFNLVFPHGFNRYADAINVTHAENEIPLVRHITPTLKK